MAKKHISMEDLKSLVRGEASEYLNLLNVSSVGIGYKIINGKTTKELCVQYTVDEKIGLESLEAPIPESFKYGSFIVPTDVIERSYDQSAKIIQNIAQANRKKRVNPISPGASVGHPSISAGTVGCVVYDNETNQEYILSNWHVLHGENGEIGDSIVQPGKYDNNRISENRVGKLVKSHLGLAGDCAIAKIDSRDLQSEIIGLGVKVEKVADPELGDKVVKSGRTTDVTYGIVSRVHITVKLTYGSFGQKQIGCFEYTPDPNNLPSNGEISMGGDSGAAVMLMKRNKPSVEMLGLHFAGETGNAREHALACYASAVFKKLEISPTEVSTLQRVRGLGFDESFLSVECKMPYPSDSETKNKLLYHNNRRVFHYTHFSLVMHKYRKLASWVAWNIDGNSIKKLNRKGFKKDPNLPEDCQIGEELYYDNPLDRGHIARRAELCWGPIKEARRANRESFYFTNIAPQHAKYNQSTQSGIWGGLENAIFDNAKIEKLRVSVYAGPIFSHGDSVYRGIQIPKEFWKVVCYVDEVTSQLKIHAFTLTQKDLINNLESLDLDDYKVYEVPIHVLSSKINFEFELGGSSGIESLELPRQVHSIDEIL